VHIEVDINIQKEEFSYAYIYAIAATAGCAVQRTTTPLDRLGVDLIITGVNNQDIIEFPLLYVQVTSNPVDCIQMRLRQNEGFSHF